MHAVPPLEHAEHLGTAESHLILLLRHLSQAGSLMDIVETFMVIASETGPASDTFT